MIFGKRAIVTAFRPFLSTPNKRVFEVALYHLGSLLAVNEQVRLADSIFELDLPVMCGDGTFTYTRILRFAQIRGSEPKQKRQAFSRRVGFDQGAPSAGPLYFVTCDSNYAARYAAAVAASVRRAAPDFSLHVHVINPTANAIDLVRRVAADHGRASVSFETTDLSRFDDRERRTYYSCSRFLFLPALMRRHNGPIVLADMDQLVIGPLGSMLDLVNTADVALLRYEQAYNNILSYFSATAMTLAKTDAAAKFAETLADNLIDLVERPGHLLWHLDQAAIAMTQFATRGPRYAFVPPGHIRTAAAAADTTVPLFWSITESVQSDPDKALAHAMSVIAT